MSLDEQVVTATRVEAATPALAATTVIDRETLERSQAQTVPDVLRKVPGLSITNSGGPGKTTSLFLRGTNNDHTVVLIDGVKVGSVSSGGAAWQDFPIEQIERIEVVRGPRSSLYGSEAIGGVIQIFTRRGQEQGVKPYLSAGYGTHDTATGSAGLSARSGAGWLHVGVSSEDTDGIDAQSHLNPTHDPDSDGYRNLSGSANAGYRFDNGLELSGNLLKTKGHSDYDGFGNPYMESEQNVVGGSAKFSPLTPWRVTLQAGRSEDKSDSFANGAFSSRFDTRRDQFSWQNDVTLAEGHTLTLGYDYQNDQLNSSTTYAEDSRDDHGGFVQYLGQIERFDWQVNGRRDVNEAFGGYNTGGAALGYAITDEVRTYVSYGTAFKAPTFNQLYYPDSGFGYAGNPDLDPERSRNLEWGMEGQPGWGRWGLNVFQNEIDDLIAFAGENNNAVNIDKARIRGIEASLGSEWRGVVWNASLSLLDPENRSSGSTKGNTLPRRSSQLFNVDLDKDLGAFGVGASVHAEGARYNEAANTNEMGGFVTVDLRGEYRITPEWRLQARVSNLLDADYETARGYSQPGQAVYFTVRYQAL